jgi:putative transposase
MLTVVHDSGSSNEDAGASRSLLDEIVRDGARQMLAAALAAEVAAYVEQFSDQLDDHGRRLVVRNGYHHEREVLTAAGAVTVTAPRVNDKRVDPDTRERQRFSSAILPAWARKSPQMTEVLPLLYLHGLSTSDFGPALEQFLGSGAGLSATTITRLTAQWQDEAKTFQDRDLSGTDYVYVWVDGIHLKVRLWGSGRRCGRCSPKPASSVVGSISSPMSLLHCRSQRIRELWRRCGRSTTPKTSIRHCGRDQGVRDRLRRQVPQGGRQDRR